MKPLLLAALLLIAIALLVLLGTSLGISGGGAADRGAVDRLAARLPRSLFAPRSVTSSQVESSCWNGSQFSAGRNQTCAVCLRSASLSLRSRGARLCASAGTQVRFAPVPPGALASFASEECRGLEPGEAAVDLFCSADPGQPQCQALPAEQRWAGVQVPRGGGAFAMECVSAACTLTLHPPSASESESCDRALPQG